MGWGGTSVGGLAAVHWEAGPHAAEVAVPLRSLVHLEMSCSG